MLYCLFGLASCYGATFAAMAAMENVQIRALRVRAQANVNHSRALGLSSDPPIERITLIVSADSSASVETLQRIREEAWKRCPAVYCVTNPVRLEVSVEAKA